MRRKQVLLSKITGIALFLLLPQKSLQQNFRLHCMSRRTASAVRKRRIWSSSCSARAIACARACASTNSASSPERLRSAVFEHFLLNLHVRFQGLEKVTATQIDS